MRRIIYCVMLVILSTGLASAGEYANNLSQCLLANTSQADKAVMTKWVFSSLSNHPALSEMATISSSMRTNADHDMARLVEKFMYEKCSGELKSAVKNEGPTAIQASIRSYVEATGREILQHPSIASSVAGLASQLDAKKMFEALMSQ